MNRREAVELINAVETINLCSLLIGQVLYSPGFDFTALGRTIEQQDYFLSRCISPFPQNVLHLYVFTAHSSVKKSCTEM